MATNVQVSSSYSIFSGQTDIVDNVLSGGFMAIQNGGIAIVVGFMQKLANVVAGACSHVRSPEHRWNADEGTA